MYKPNETKMPDNNAGMIAMANASKDAAIAQSNNGLMAMQTQSAVMELGIMENSKNTQFQTLAWLTTQLAGLDAKLDIAKQNATIALKEEDNRHTETMKGLDIDAITAKRGDSIDTSSFKV